MRTSRAVRLAALEGTRPPQKAVSTHSLPCGGVVLCTRIISPDAYLGRRLN